MPTFFDTETRSRVPIQFGTDQYLTGAEPLMLTFCRDDDRAQYWDVIGGEPTPRDFADAVADPDESLFAHNVPFDRGVMSRLLGIRLPVHRYRCTMAQARAHGLPGSLGTLGTVLGLREDQQKLVEDGKLIDLFCVPDKYGNYADRYTHPAEWQRFVGYGVRDAEALREIWKRLPKHNYQGVNLETWWLDQLVNERGFGFDAELARAARKLLDAAKIRHDGEVSAQTAGEVAAVTQRAKLLAYFQRVGGLDLPNMRAATIREYLEHDDPRPEMRILLELRLEGSKSSGAKYRRGLETMGPDGRVRYGIQFSGAGRTGRFSGRNFQAHNLPRPVTNIVTPEGEHQTIPVKAKYVLDVIIPGILSGDALHEPMIYGGPNEACANALRGCIVPAPGNELVVADWSNIEGRVMAWIADARDLLYTYEAQNRGEKADSYMALASVMFGIPLEKLLADPKSYDNYRQAAKVVTLACQYGGSVGALATMAGAYNMDLELIARLALAKATPEQLKKAERAWVRAFLTGEDWELEYKTYVGCHVLVQAYREANDAITQVRHDVDNATKLAVKNPGQIFDVAKCRIMRSGTSLIIQLPSGRRLLYADPKLHIEAIADPETGKSRNSEYVSYLTARGKNWLREKAWSGLFIENIVQAIANDCLRAGLLIAHRETLKVDAIRDYLELVEGAETAIALHVHDEVVLDVPAGSYSLAALLKNLTTDVLAEFAWTRGLPLAAAGWVGTRYRK
jgi:DNA polymerase